MTTVEAWRRSRLGPEALFRSAVRDWSKLTELMRGVQPVTPFHTTADYTYLRRQLAADRYLLAGDAGGFFDPIFSSGVHLTTWSAAEAVRLVARAERAGRPLRPAEARRYTRRVKRHAGVFLRLIEAFYDNASFAVFLHPQPPLGLGRALPSIVAGRSHLTWPRWWRFHAFLLVCRIQRRRPLVPPIVWKQARTADPGPAPTAAHSAAAVR